MRARYNAKHPGLNPNIPPGAKSDSQNKLASTTQIRAKTRFSQEQTEKGQKLERNRRPSQATRCQVKKHTAPSVTLFRTDLPRDTMHSNGWRGLDQAACQNAVALYHAPPVQLRDSKLDTSETLWQERQTTSLHHQLPTKTCDQPLCLPGTALGGIAEASQPRAPRALRVYYGMVSLKRPEPWRDQCILRAGWVGGRERKLPLKSLVPNASVIPLCTRSKLSQTRASKNASMTCAFPHLNQQTTQSNPISQPNTPHS